MSKEILMSRGLLISVMLFVWTIVVSHLVLNRHWSGLRSLSAQQVN